MPKKGKKTSKKEENSERDILKELAETLKFKTASKNNARNDIEFGGIEFNQFMNTSKNVSGSPVLERIAGQQGTTPVFVRQATREVLENSSGAEKDDFKYVPSQSREEEAMYTGSTHIETETEPVNVQRIGRERQDFFRQGSSERFVATDSPGSRTMERERIERVKQYDVKSAGREGPFDKSSSKNEKYRPKVPKGW